MTRSNVGKTVILALLVLGGWGFSVAVSGALETLPGGGSHDAVFAEAPLRALYVKTVGQLDKNGLAYCNEYEVVVDYLGEPRRYRQHHPVINAVVKCDPEFLETPRWDITWRDHDEDTDPQLELSYVKAWCEGIHGERIAPSEVRLLCYERPIE
ncbi:MAG: hypothetical protein AB7D06_03870 [Pedobacter sp.]